MNEDYAIEPTSFRSALELKYVLEKFGFHHGRFLAAYPSKWIRLVKERIQEFPDVERSRAIYVLDKYKDECIFRCGLEYSPDHTWIDNAAPHVQSKAFQQIFTAQKSADGMHPCIDELSDDMLGDSRAARITALAKEYQKVARKLIKASREIWLIDPYMDVSRPARKKVLQALLSIAAESAPYRIVLIARHSKCLNENYKSILDGLLRPYAGLNFSIELKLVDDAGSIHKMHARYLLSIKGALRFEKGFVEEAIESQMLEVETVSRAIHRDLCHLYLDGQHGFDVIDSFLCTPPSSR